MTQRFQCGHPGARFKREVCDLYLPGMVCQAHADEWRKKFGDDRVHEMPARLRGVTWEPGPCEADTPLSCPDWRAATEDS
jgi:hypothetical protein